MWAPCTGQPTYCGRGSAWPSPPPSTRGIIRCRHSRGYLYTRVLQCARVAASCGAGTACHTLARHVYSLVWAWADITLWKGGAASRVTCHVSPCAGLWDGYDHYAGWGVAQSGATLGAGLLLLSATRTVRSAFGAPVASLDSIYTRHYPAPGRCEHGHCGGAHPLPHPAGHQPSQPRPQEAARHNSQQDRGRGGDLPLARGEETQHRYPE